MSHCSKMKLVLSLLFIFPCLFVNAEETNSWSGELRSFFSKCMPLLKNIKGQKSPFFGNLRSCLQRKTLIAMDDLLLSDVIPISTGLDLVRYRKGKVTTNQDEKNETSNSRDSDNDKTWRKKVFERFARIFRSHVLKIDIDRLIGATDSISHPSRENASDLIVEGRRRHRKRNNQLMPMLMMGVMVMGSVLIPMGFQFLAVLGGKALILAKLALLLSSIQGLKKIATNGINYGLYHTPVSEGWHERSHNEPQAQYEVPYHIYARS